MHCVCCRSNVSLSDYPKVAAWLASLDEVVGWRESAPPAP